MFTLWPTSLFQAHCSNRSSYCSFFTRPIHIHLYSLSEADFIRPKRVRIEKRDQFDRQYNLINIGWTFFILLLLLFKYSCLHFLATSLPRPTHPHLPPSVLPPLALSMRPLYMFLDDLEWVKKKGLGLRGYLVLPISSTMYPWSQAWKLNQPWILSLPLHLAIAYFCHCYLTSVSQMYSFFPASTAIFLVKTFLIPCLQ